MATSQAQARRSSSRTSAAPEGPAPRKGAEPVVDLIAAVDAAVAKRLQELLKELLPDQAYALLHEAAGNVSATTDGFGIFKSEQLTVEVRRLDGELTALIGGKHAKAVFIANEVATRLAAKLSAVKLRVVVSGAESLPPAQERVLKAQIETFVPTAVESMLVFWQRTRTLFGDLLGNTVAELYELECAKIAASGSHGAEQLAKLEAYVRIKKAEARLGRLTWIRHFGGLADDLATKLRPLLEDLGIVPLPTSDTASDAPAPAATAATV